MVAACTQVNNTLKYHLSSFGGYLYFTLLFVLLLQYIHKENNVLFSSCIFPDTQKYSLHFECLAGWENGPIQALIKRTSLVIPTHSDPEDSLNTNALFVNDVWVLECAPFINIRNLEIICTFTSDT
jgi:hypothetical protein